MKTTNDDFSNGYRLAPAMGLRKRVLYSLCLLQTALIICGCPSTPTTPPKEETNNSERSRPTSTRQCGEQFKNGFQLMLPESLGLESDSKTAILLINEWFNVCGQKLVSVDGKSLIANMASDFSDSGIASRIQNENFDSRDVSHIRTSILCREIVEHATKKDRTDLKRAQTLFEYSVRNISIAPNVAERVPRTLFEVLLFGLGGHEDRVWLFANLMRQLRIDVVAITPSGENSSDHILAGVLLDDQIYIFDPIKGSAVYPAGDSTNDEMTPGTWKDIANGTLKVDGFLDPNTPPKVFAIGNASLWAPRMSAVQEQLVGEKDYVVFEPFTTESKTKGLMDRIGTSLSQSFGKDSIPKVGIWSYPIQRIQQFEDPGEQEQALINVMMAPFRTTSTTSRRNTGQNEGDVQTTSRQEQQFRMARLAQLQGKYDEALPAFFKIRLDQSRKISASLGSNDARTQLARVIAEDSHYWTGLSQFEKGKFDQTINTLSSYLKKFDNRIPGNEDSLFRWSNSAITLLARSYIQQGKLDEAIKTLKMMPEKDPESERTAQLNARLMEMAKQSSSDPES